MIFNTYLMTKLNPTISKNGLTNHQSINNQFPFINNLNIYQTMLMHSLYH